MPRLRLERRAERVRRGTMRVTKPKPTFSERDCPVPPHLVIKCLYERHAWHDEKRRVCANPARLAALMGELGLGAQHREKFKQQLQRMARADHFGLHHGYYPTGWQLTTAGAMAWRRFLAAGELAGELAASRD